MSTARDDAVVEAFVHFTAALSAAEFETLRRLIAQQDEVWIRAGDAMHKLLRRVSEPVAAQTSQTDHLRADKEPEPDDGLIRTLSKGVN